MSDTGKRDPRGANFLPAEIDLLVDLASKEKYRRVLECKASDTRVWSEKAQMWQALCDDFNSQCPGEPRLKDQLKKKYEGIKKAVKIKCAQLRQERYKTGGGPAVNIPLTPIEEKVKNLIAPIIDGLEDHYGPDFVEGDTATEKYIVEVLEDDADDATTIYHREIGCYCEKKILPNKKSSHTESMQEVRVEDRSKAETIVTTSLLPVKKSSATEGMQPALAGDCLKAGTFITVTIRSGKKFYTYALVCQEDADEVAKEVHVMFLQFFRIKDDDVSYVLLKDVTKVLEEPAIHMKGKRMFSVNEKQ